MWKPGVHGRDHRPGGSDPAEPGVRHDVGTAGEPAFENGWGNQTATVDVPFPEAWHFLIVIGAPNILDPDSGEILKYMHKVLEICGDIVGGAAGTTVFTLPAAYRFERDRPFDGHDDAKNPIASRLFADGRFVYDTA